MEQAAGVAYAAATECKCLVDGRLDWTRYGSIPSSQNAWASAWVEFRALGLGPMDSGASEFTSAPPLESRKLDANAPIASGALEFTRVLSLLLKQCDASAWR